MQSAFSSLHLHLLRVLLLLRYAVCERYGWRVEKVDSTQFACPSALTRLAAAQHAAPAAISAPATSPEAGALARLESQLVSLAEYTAFVDS